MSRRVKRAPTQKLQFLWIKTNHGDHLPMLIKENADAPLVAKEDEVTLPVLHLKEVEDECQTLLDDALQFLAVSFQNAKEAKEKIRARRLSVAPAATIVPQTPHTNKHKRVRKFILDDQDSPVGSLQNDSLEEICPKTHKESETAAEVVEQASADISEITAENLNGESSQSNHESEVSVAKPTRKTRSSVKKRPPSSTARTRRITRSSKAMSMLPNIEEVQRGDEKQVGKKGKTKKTVTLKEPVVVHEEVPDVENLPETMNATPVVETTCDNLTSMETGPEPTSENPVPDNSESVCEVRHLIAIHEAFIDKQQFENCETPAKTVAEQMDVASDSQERDGIRSMAERVASCVKKKPVVRIFKIADEQTANENMMTPEKPITLKLDLGSSDDEIDEDDVSDFKVYSKFRSDIVTTPHGTVSPREVLPVRRSLNLHLSFDDSSDKTASDGKTSQEENDENMEAGTSPDDEDSLDDETEDGESKVQGDDDSAASSSAATILSDECMEFAMVQEKHALQEVRRSSRLKRNLIDSIPEEDAYISSVKGQTSKQPKIIKPVLVPKIVLRGMTKSAISVKRAIDQVESGGAMSPARPKKFMKCASPLCQQKSKKTTTLTKRSRNTFLNRSTAASRSRRTPGLASPSVSSRTRPSIFSATTFNPTLTKTTLGTPSRHGNLSTEVQSFIRRNTPQKTKSYKEQQAAKEEQLKEKEAREREAKKRKEEEKKREALERKKKTTEKLQRAAKLRMQREKEESEKKAKMIEQWEKRVADADNVKVLRKKEEEAKGKILRKKQLDAAEAVRKEEEERSKKIKDIEQEKERRLQEQRLLREQEAAAKRQAEQEKLQEKLRLEKLKEEQEEEVARERQEQEKIKREAEERAKLRKAEEAARLRQQRHDKEELERKRKVQEEINRRNAEATKLEQERIEKEKEAQRKQKEENVRRQEEAIRRKEKEEARKRKIEETKVAEELKAIKRKEEMAKTEELRKKREAIRKEAEMRREEERAAEKRRLEEEKERKQQEEKEKMRQIKEANERLKVLQEEQQKQKALLKNMGQGSPSPCLNSTYNVSSYDMTPHVPKQYAPSTEDDYNIDDITSGDSTDDDEQPRKTVPKWAKGALLRSAIINQYYNFSAAKISKVFDSTVLLKQPDLGEIFKTFKPRYNKRTSSAQWKSPVKDIGHVSFSEYCRAPN